MKSSYIYIYIYIYIYKKKLEKPEFSFFQGMLCHIKYVMTKKKRKEESSIVDH